MAVVHQFVQSLVAHDAISTHARHLQRVMRNMGVESDIYAGEQQKQGAKFFRDLKPGGSDTWLMYHLSTGSPLAAFFQERPERLAVNYHNISPIDSFAAWEPTIGIELEAARRQLSALAPSTDKAIAVSRYNEVELITAGYSNTSVAPVLFDPEDFERELDVKLDAKLRKAKVGGGSDWLFTGRVSPHKAQHDIVKAFAVYRQLYDNKARLHIVGGMSSHHYWTVLNRYVAALQLTDAVNITGGVSNGALGAYYRNADVFVCLSDHEGFGVPLFEAMHNHLPIVAFSAAAVPETVGNAALLLNDKAPSTGAAAVHRVLTDSALRNALVRAGSVRLDDFTLARSEKIWQAEIEAMLEKTA